MAIFEGLDGPGLAARIRSARQRVILCAPGFADDVASALIEVYRRLGVTAVSVVIDGTDHAARLGYGHYNAVALLAEAGVGLRLEPGLRLGAVVIDNDGWCFATPPLLVDATMENAEAPNAMRLTSEQVAVVVAATTPLSFKPASGASAVEPELGRTPADVNDIAALQAALQADPPQRFDVARKVNVFNAFVEFVELELQGTQLTRQRVRLPAELLLAVSDAATRERLTTSFQLINPQAAIGRGAVELRKKVEKLRTAQNLHALKDYGTVGLRSNRARLDTAIQALRAEVAAFADEVRKRLKVEIDHSRKQLVKSIVPAIKAKPPEAFLSGIVGKPTAEQFERWVNRQLDRTFPTVDQIARDMRLSFAIKAVTYETLNDPAFQTAVRAAFPEVNFDKPFREFAAAPTDARPAL